MLKLDGQLYVQTRNGRNGRFNVGRLITPNGEFIVKDRHIEELDEGTYDGTFGVGKFYVTTNILPSGAIIVEQRVRLEELWLNDETKLPTDASVGVEETDPLEEETKAIADAQPAVATATDAAAAESEEEATADEASEHGELFGELWPLGNVVKLDPSIDRPKLRTQINVLKAMGYRFNSKEKSWHQASQAA